MIAASRSWSPKKRMSKAIIIRMGKISTNKKPITAPRLLSGYILADRNGRYIQASGIVARTAIGITQNNVRPTISCKLI
jgi:hypothetical protein